MVKRGFVPKEDSDEKGTMQWFDVAAKCGHIDRFPGIDKESASVHASQSECDDCADARQLDADEQHSQWMKNYYAQRREWNIAAEAARKKQEASAKKKSSVSKKKSVKSARVVTG
jgi:hypothetical protein